MPETARVVVTRIMETLDPVSDADDATITRAWEALAAELGYGSPNRHGHGRDGRLRLDDYKP